jgi:predicted dehydrogenase
MYAVLLIGIGNRGLAWAQAVRAHPGFRLAGVADIDPAVLAGRGTELGIAAERRHPDYRQALAAGGYDLAIVVVPNHLHYRLARDVLEAGLPCLLEKPFAETLSEAEELVGLAERKRLPLVIAQNYRFKKPFQLIAETIRSKDLGLLHGVEASFRRHRPPRYEHERTMKYPLLFLQAIHHLDWLLGCLPAPIDDLDCRFGLPAGSPWRSPSLCHLILRCRDGVLVSYRGSYECLGEQTPYNGLWRFEFHDGDLLLDQAGLLWRIQGERRSLLYEPGREEERSSDELLLDTLYEAIAEGTEAPTSGRRNLDTLRLLFRVIERGEKG